MEQLIELRRTAAKSKKVKQARERARLGLPPRRPWYKDCCINLSTWGKETVGRACCPCRFGVDRPKLTCEDIPCFNKTTCCGRCCYPETFEHAILTSFMGFFGGLVLSSLWFYVMVYQLGYPLSTSVITSAALGTTLTIGCAFSYTMRCLTLLAIPQLFSSKGRTALIMLTFVMLVNGPMVNFQNNIHVMAESATCGTQLTYNATKELINAAASPMKDLVDSVQSVLEGLQQLALRLRDAFLEVQALYVEILSGISRAFDWLADMVNVCNYNMGEPYRRCMDAFNNAEATCHASLSILISWLMCPLAGILASAFDFVCEIARIGELLCLVTAVITDFITNTLQEQINFAINDVIETFYFNVTFTYYYDVEMNQSRTFGDVRRDIQAEIESRLAPMQRVATGANFMLVAALLWLMIKSLYYRYRFLSNDRYDNCYITPSIGRLNKKRKELKREALLPLDWRERSRFPGSMSLLLGRSEKLNLISGLLFLSGSMLHASFYLSLDYGLYWMLDMIRSHGALKMATNSPNQVRMHVEGQGVLADIYRAIITQFDPLEKVPMYMDTSPCLPQPSEPDYLLYKRIGVILGACLVLVLLEAYGLRLRHMIMGCYYPKREKQRAVWLYNHIMRRRGSFLKFLRRKVRKERNRHYKSENITFSAKIGSCSPFCAKWLRRLGMMKPDIMCLACGLAQQEKENYKEDDTFVHCVTPKCDGVYCDKCHDDLNNLCTLCMKPIDYGDLSDISEEKDSSEDEGLDPAMQWLKDKTTPSKMEVLVAKAKAKIEREQASKAREKSTTDDIHERAYARRSMKSVLSDSGRGMVGSTHSTWKNFDIVHNETNMGDSHNRFTDISPDFEHGLYSDVPLSEAEQSVMMSKGHILSRFDILANKTNAIDSRDRFTDVLSDFEHGLYSEVPMSEVEQNAMLSQGSIGSRFTRSPASLEPSDSVGSVMNETQPVFPLPESRDGQYRSFQDRSDAPQKGVSRSMSFASSYTSSMWSRRWSNETRSQYSDDPDQGTAWRETSGTRDLPGVTTRSSVSDAANRTRNRTSSGEAHGIDEVGGSFNTGLTSSHPGLDLDRVYSYVHNNVAYSNINRTVEPVSVELFDSDSDLDAESDFSDDD